MKKTLITNSPKETFALGQQLAPWLFKGCVIALSGDLGAGKTTLTAGVASGLDVLEHVISPTFNIMRIYMHGRLPLFHIDAYRLEDGNADIGLEEFIDDGGVSIIEWPQYVSEFVPANSLNISLRNLGPTQRELAFETNEPRFETYLASLGEVSL